VRIADNGIGMPFDLSKASFATDAASVIDPHIPGENLLSVQTLGIQARV
jgi:hypothetical protein